MLHRVFDYCGALAIIFLACRGVANAIYLFERPKPELRKGLRRE